MAGDKLFGRWGEYSFPALFKEVETDRECFTQEFVAGTKALSHSRRCWLLTNVKHLASQTDACLPRDWLAARRAEVETFKICAEQINKHLAPAASQESRGDITAFTPEAAGAEACLQSLVRLTQLLAAYIVSGHPLKAEDIPPPNFEHLCGFLVHPHDFAALQKLTFDRRAAVEGWFFEPLNALSGL